MLRACFCVYRSRYTELVGPLIVHAQHKLAEIVSENGSKPVPQPHFIAAVAANSGLPITAADYARLQLRVVVDGTDKVEQKETKAAVEPRENVSYSRMSYNTCHVMLSHSYY